PNDHRALLRRAVRLGSKSLLRTVLVAMGSTAQVVNARLILSATPRCRSCLPKRCFASSRKAYRGRGCLLSRVWAHQQSDQWRITFAAFKGKIHWQRFPEIHNRARHFSLVPRDVAIATWQVAAADSSRPT